MTVTDLPTSVRPVGLARLRALTGAASDEQAVNEAIRRLEATDDNKASGRVESGPERNRRLLAEMDTWEYDGSSASGADIVAVIEKGRAERTESILRAIRSQ